MTKYEQAPSGWWQDSKNRPQPPGSYADPTLRIPAEPAGTAPGESRTWVRRILTALHLV